MHRVIGAQQCYELVCVDLAALPTLQHAPSEKADAGASDQDSRGAWVCRHALLNAGRVPAKFAGAICLRPVHSEPVGVQNLDYSIAGCVVPARAHRS